MLRGKVRMGSGCGGNRCHSGPVSRLLGLAAAAAATGALSTPAAKTGLAGCLLLPAVMVDAFQAIWELHTEDKIPLRTAAFVKALQRVTRARVHRGFD